MQSIRTWWGQRFIAALECFTDNARLARGRAYANENRITSWHLRNGEMAATIRGNVNPYFGVYKEPLYNTRLALKPISATDWQLLIRHLGSRAAFISRLLLNEMPDNIEKPFELLDLHLLPHSGKDFKTQCSCPDYANPCKHVAGLCYFLSAQLDQDPFLLFELRGLPREQLFEQLRQTPLGKALSQAREETPAEDDFAADSFFTRPQAITLAAPCDPLAFWSSAKRLPDNLPAAAHATVPALLVKKGGDFPEFWPKPMPFPQAMEWVYDAIRKRSKEW